LNLIFITLEDLKYIKHISKVKICNFRAFLDELLQMLNSMNGVCFLSNVDDVIFVYLCCLSEQ